MHGRRGLVVVAAFEQVEHRQMLAAVLDIAAAVLHRAIRQQAPHAVDAADGVDEESVAGTFDQRFVEAHAPVVQLVGRVGLDAAIEQMQVGRPAARDDEWREAVARLAQGRRLQRQLLGLQLAPKPG